MMGFDTFTSKELMNITEYTPLGSWPTDDILVDETIKSMDATPDRAGSCLHDHGSGSRRLSDGKGH